MDTLPWAISGPWVSLDSHARLVTGDRGLDQPNRDQLDPSRLVARAGRSKAPELAGHGGRSRAAAGRETHKDRSSAQDTVRNPAANHNRDHRIAKRAGTLRAARRPSREPPTGRRHKDKARPPGAELVRRYTAEEQFAPERRGLAAAHWPGAPPCRTGSVRPLGEDRPGRRLSPPLMPLWQLRLPNASERMIASCCFRPRTRAPPVRSARSYLFPSS
jgi:hypothetical protein